MKDNMSGRTKRRRLNADMDGTLAGGAAMCDDAAYVSSISDKGLWNGFCEIESEPVSKIHLPHPDDYDCD
jgi:hypothetical protein